MKPVLAIALSALSFVLMNSAGMWQHLESRGVVEVNDEAYAMILYVSYSLLNAVFCMVIYSLTGRSTKAERLSRWIIMALCVSFLADCLQSILGGGYRGAGWEALFMLMSIVISFVIEFSAPYVRSSISSPFQRYRTNRIGFVFGEKKDSEKQ